MDTLWAGWRSTYIATAGEPDEHGCLFCRLPEADDTDALILKRGTSTFVVLNRYPYTTGHIMVAPYRHVDGPIGLTDEEQAEIWELLGESITAIDGAMHPDGYNLGANLGQVAGAGVPGHFHLHLVPRWSGDANFMTTIGDTRVIPEDLHVTWRRLRDAFSS